jgi:hypothetical protein
MAIALGVWLVARTRGQKDHLIQRQQLKQIQGW